MMRSYVCQQCRLQLSRRLALPQYPQLQSTRTIVSFRNPPNAPRPNAEAPSEEANNERNAVQEEQSHQGGGVRIRYAQVGRREAALEGRYSRSAQPGNAQQEQYYEQQEHRDSSHVLKANPSISVAQKINNLLDWKTAAGVKAAWDLFDKTYTSRDVPALTDPSFSDVHLLTGGKIFSRLNNLVCLEFERGNTQVPTPTEVLFRYEQLEITPATAWKQTFANLTYQFLRTMAKRPKDQAGRPTPKNRRSTEETLAELLSLWKLFFQRHGTRKGRDPLEHISSEWKNIPETEVSFNTGKIFGARLQQFHQSHATSPELQFSAITIFNYFFAEAQLPRTIPDHLREQNKPFLNLLISTLAGADIRVAFGQIDADPRIKRNLDDDFRRSMAVQMDEAPSLARKINGLDVGSATPEEKASHMQDFYLKRIGRQVMMQANATEVEKLWLDAENHYKSPDGKSQIPPALYNAFLSGFMTLYQPEQTVRVWNHMIANGVVPDLETWLAMLLGCAKAKDLTGLNAVWDRMLRAGIEPDQRCWTMRIHAMITCREVTAGLAALDEMGKRWLSAENVIKNPPNRGKGGKQPPSNAKIVNKSTKPEIGVINGAVDAIVGLPTRGKVKTQLWKGMSHEKKVDFVHKILQWAGNFSIKPDTRTYNALISLYLDGDDYTTTFKLLRQMEKEGIEGDLATHSMLLRAAFDNKKFDGLTQNEQAERVITLFSELEQGGLKPNTYVFQIAIDRLLKHYGNYLGVRAVMDHMMNRGFRPGPQIYTSLVTHYLQRDPPAIRELDSLVARIFGPPAAPTDRYLFDRIVEGYARNDEIASMMTVLTKMGAQGKRPSFRALSEVVRALYRSGDWERARGIIRDVQLGEGVAKTVPMPTHNVDRDQFFHIVKALCPELLESFAGEHLKTPVRASGAAQVAIGVAAADQVQTPSEQAQYEQQSYEQYQPQQQAYEQAAYQQSYDQSAYEQAPYDAMPYEQTPYDQAQQAPYQQPPYQQQPYDVSLYEQTQMSYQQTSYQQTPEMDDEFVNAEHAGYLSNEPEVPQQQWRSSNEAAGNR